MFAGGVKTVITEHFEVLIRDMTNKFFDKFGGRDGLGNKLIIFMAIVMESNILTVVIVNSRHGNNRTTKITGDVFDDFFGVRKSRFGIDIETVRTVFVAKSLHFFEGRTKVVFKFV